jgi:hypothetical protein
MLEILYAHILFYQKNGCDLYEFQKLNCSVLTLSDPSVCITELYKKIAMSCLIL